MINNETKGNGIAGLIPDFFHDVIAYLIPGYTIIILLFIDSYVATHEFLFKVNDFGVAAFFFVTVLAYVIGRFLEQLGLNWIHHRKFPFLSESYKFNSPKWGLVFDKKDETYTGAFKDIVAKKLEEWINTPDWEKLIEYCKNNKKDDYFNLVQFYLRERYPIVALYEKKQMATIVLTRSLAVGFLLNVVLNFVILFMLVHPDSIVFSGTALTWLVVNIIFSVVLYSRFKQDKKYHSMYIFETFIATKKLLKPKSGYWSTKTPKPNTTKKQV